MTGIEGIAGNIFYIPYYGVVKRKKVKTSPPSKHVKHRPQVLTNALQVMELFSMNTQGVIFKIKQIICYESSNR